MTTGKVDDLHFYLLDKLQSLSSSNTFPTWEYQRLITHWANNKDKITCSGLISYKNVGSLALLPLDSSCLTVHLLKLFKSFYKTSLQKKGRDQLEMLLGQLKIIFVLLDPLNQI